MTALFSSQRQRGFSITELMVAMTIGLVILAAVSTVFVNAGKAYNQQDRVARVQDNGRFAMYYLIRDLRMAGYNGCLRDLSNSLSNNLNTTTGFSFGTVNFQTSVEGIDDVSSGSTPTWSPSGDSTLPTNVWKDAVAKPDLLAIRMLDTSAMASITDSPMANPSANPTVDHPEFFKKGDVVFLADCLRADVFQISDNPTSSTLPHAIGGSLTPGNATAELSKQYNQAAKVFKFSARRYYIATNANGVPSLYRDDNGINAVELVEGIESLQVLYGVTNSPPSGPPAMYYKASAITAAYWPSVVSIKIGILARTPNAKETDTDAKTYDLNGTTIGPFNDRNSRRVFSATISLKDRVLP